MILRPDYLEKLNQFIDVKVVKILAGIRRCGKSTILEMLKQNLISRGIDEAHIITKKYSSEEYDNFYNNVVFSDKYAADISAKDGKYVITRLNGQQIIVEQGGLSQAGLLNQLYFDYVLNECKLGISSWSHLPPKVTLSTGLVV